MQSKIMQTGIEGLEKISKIVFATSNENKVKEIKEKLEEQKVNIQLILPNLPFDPEENGKNFYENALIKAKAAAKLMNMPALADDSGLCVDALNGAPGIHSARYAQTPMARIDRVLENLREVSENERTAHFICSMVLVDEKGEVLFSTEGRVDGLIIKELKGKNGFGYDPIFYISNLHKTMAEMTLEEKNSYSHRSIAVTKFVEWLSIKK